MSAVFFEFCKFYRCKNIGPIDFSDKKESTFYQSAKFYGSSPKETRENSLSVLFFVLTFT